MKKGNQQEPAASVQAEAIFFDALEFETQDEQNAFVLEACAGDEVLRNKVDGLLTSRAEAEAFFTGVIPLMITAEDLVETLANIENPPSEQL